MAGPWLYTFLEYIHNIFKESLSFGTVKISHDGNRALKKVIILIITILWVYAVARNCLKETLDYDYQKTKQKQIKLKKQNK